MRRPVDSGREQGGIYMFVSRPSMTKIVRCTTRLLFIENEMIDNLVFFVSKSELTELRQDRVNNEHVGLLK